MNSEPPDYKSGALPIELYQLYTNHIHQKLYRKFLLNVNKTLKRKLFYFLKIEDFLDSRSITLNDAKSLNAKNDKTLRSNKISKLRNDPINFE